MIEPEPEPEPEPVELCGNGILEPGEVCDPAIAAGSTASCPTVESCDDGDPCTTDSLSGSGCAVTCARTQVVLHIGGDRCCPAGATASSDADCTAACGNGAVEPGEVCDTGIAQGPGACPATCSDGVSCTADVREELTPGNACTAMCRFPEITSAGPADACCPQGATPGSDPDCAGCGDGVVRGSESCDTGIASGPGRCPTSADCEDGNACTIGQLVAAGTCNAQCIQTPITGDAGGDGCCLQPGVTPKSSDSDCPLLAMYFECQTASDCMSGECTAFDFYSGAKICTASCDPNMYAIDGGCPASAGAIAMCMTRPAANGVRDDACVIGTLDPYIATDTNIGVLLVGANLPGTLHAADDLDLYFLGGALDAANIRIRITPEAGLDPVIAFLGESFASATVCNNAAAGQADECFATIPANGGRSFFLVQAAQGTGAYTLTAELAQ